MSGPGVDHRAAPGPRRTIGRLMGCVVGIGLVLTLMRGAIPPILLGPCLGLTAFLLPTVVLPAALGRAAGRRAAGWIYALWPLLVMMALYLVYGALLLIMETKYIWLVGPVELIVMQGTVKTALWLSLLAPLFYYDAETRVGPALRDDEIARPRILRGALVAIPLACAAAYGLWRFVPIGATRLFDL